MLGAFCGIAASWARTKHPHQQLSPSYLGQAVEGSDCIDQVEAAQAAAAAAANPGAGPYQRQHRLRALGGADAAVEVPVGQPRLLLL